MIAIIGDDWTQLMQGPRETLRVALNALPAEVFEANARLGVARDYLNFIPDSGEVRPVRFQHTPSPPAGLLDTLAVLTARTASDRFIGAFDRAVDTVREIHRTLADVSDEALVAVRPVLAEMRVQWAISLLFGGHLTDALHGFERSYDEALAFGNTRMAAESAGSIAFIASLGGDRRERERWIARMPALDVAAPPDTVGVMGGLAAAVAAIDGLDPAAASAALDRTPGDETAPEQWVLRMYVESRLAAKFGDPRAQLVQLRAAARSHLPALSQSGLNHWLLRLSEATLLQAIGDLRASAEVAGELRGSRVEAAVESGAIVSAWVLARQGEARRALAVAGPFLVQADTPRTSVEMLAVTAAAQLQLGREQDAAASFTTGLQLALHEGLHSVLTHFEGPELEALELAAGIRVPPAIASALERANRPVFGRPAVAALSHREQVVLRLLIEGLSTDQIAQHEHVSRNTIKSQTQSLFRKIEVSSREAAVELGLAHPELWASV